MIWLLTGGVDCLHVWLVVIVVSCRFALILVSCGV